MSLLYPVAALAALTFAVGLRVFYARINAARRGRVRARDFRLGESENVPPDVVLPNRNFKNLLEMPVLFYVACILLAVADKAGGADVALAWAYVGLRAAHSAVHLTYNNVLHRLAAFMASNLVLLALWVRLLLAY